MHILVIDIAINKDYIITIVITRVDNYTGDL